MATINKATIAVFLSTVLLMTACTSVEETTEVEPEQSELSRISVLALDNNIQIKPDDTFSWHDDLAVIGVDKTAQESLLAVLTTDIEAGIKTFQHEFIKGDKADSTFKLAAMAVLDKNGEEALSLVNHFGIDPGLGNSQMDHDKGALVLAVTNKDNVMLWRGVVQIFTAENLDEKSRMQRRERAINLLLKELFSKTVEAEVPAAMM